MNIAPQSGTVALLIPEDHPAFPGHFPGHPITPGVVLLDLAVTHLCELAATPVAGCQISQGKFLSPVAPGTNLSLSYTFKDHGVRFEIAAGDRKVASGVITFSISSPTPA